MAAWYAKDPICTPDFTSISRCVYTTDMRDTSRRKDRRVFVYRRGGIVIRVVIVAVESEDASSWGGYFEFSIGVVDRALCG